MARDENRSPGGPAGPAVVGCGLMLAMMLATGVVALRSDPFPTDTPPTVGAWGHVKAGGALACPTREAIAEVRARGRRAIDAAVAGTAAQLGCARREAGARGRVVAVEPPFVRVRLASERSDVWLPAGALRPDDE